MVDQSISNGCCGGYGDAAATIMDVTKRVAVHRIASATHYWHE